MHLEKHLELISKQVLTASIPSTLKSEVRNLTVYLKTQSIADLDRRDRQHNICEAVDRYLHCLTQVALYATFQQPSSFWQQLDSLAGRKTSVSRMSALLSPTGSDNWDCPDFFKYLTAEIGKIVESEERNNCLRALDALLKQTAKPRFARNMKENERLWRTVVHPIVSKAGLLEPLKNNSTLRSRLNLYFKGHF